jgi:hypothetical protein
MSCGGGPGSLVGSIVFGTGVEGSVLSATGAPKGPQLPVVVSGEAKEVVNSTAKLTGTVAARGVATTYRFEYGPTKGYGTSVPVPSASAGEGRLPVEVSQSVTGLEEGTLYYFRLVASNSSGTSYGEAKTFTPGYPSYWEVNGKIATPSVTGKGTLKVLGVECAVVESGKVLLGGGEVTSVSCPGVAQCEGSSEVEAVGLPWKTELVDVPVKNGGGEVERYEVRERFYGASGKEPGWDLVCKGKPVLSCSGEVSGNLENISSGVVVEFDSSSPRMSCGGGPGSLVGSIVFGTGEESNVLSATGAPKGPQIPVAATGEAKEVTSSSAKLTGTIATRGAATTYHFEYGPTKSYGTNVPVPNANGGESRLPIEVSQNINGLQPRMLYHYRLVATNSGGTAYGEDKTLSTEYPAEWLLNGALAVDDVVKSEGTLTMHDSGLEVTAECQVDESGEVGILREKVYNVGEITHVTGTKGETAITCHPTQTGWCGTAAIQIEATYLPWNTELTDPPVENASHEVHYEPRVRSYGTVQPAWTVKCGFMGSTAVDTCAGEPAGEVKNTASGVAVKFESKSPALACTGSAIGTGTVEGTLSLTSATEGKTLSVYGAPGP